MLHHHYRLSELARKTWHISKSQWDALLMTRSAPGFGGAVWIRCFDTHDVVVVSNLQDAFSDFYTELYGVLTWSHLAAIPMAAGKTDAANRHLDYEAHLAGNPVLDTLRVTFDSLAVQL